ncbi:hypothetical protein BDP27DRAFT_1408441 [Rhodocollybia butyracea]|uniref:Hydrophobin n=1 Tax=Rhodocollybia butyracea TaxID=206335 RepID=A0A9P5TXL8_9AGAR|nr:hypothetical protein BDP27DRAFT_1408441 [Rhodocollybia butyracea]
MQFKLTLITAALVTLAGATPAPRSESTVCSAPSGIVCCDLVKPASDPLATYLIKNLGIIVSSTSTVVGMDCSPISAVSGICSGELVCCEDNSNDPLISIGCTPAISD